MGDGDDTWLSSHQDADLSGSRNGLPSCGRSAKGLDRFLGPKLMGILDFSGAQRLEYGVVMHLSSAVGNLEDQEKNQMDE